MNLKVFVLITAIIELLAGVGMFLVPDMIPMMEGEGPMALTLARMYGAAALAVGYYALMVWKSFAVGPAKGFCKTFIVFHLGVAVAAYFGYSQGLADFLPVMALHAILGFLSIFYFVSNK